MSRLGRSALALAVILAPLAHADRGFVTDHPGPVDSPKTAPVGDARVETNLAVLSREHGGGPDQDEAIFGGGYLAVGVNERAEFQVGTDGFATSDHHVGQISARMKINLLGDDEGIFALAVTPRLAYGVGSAPGWTAGLTLPAAWGFAEHWTIAAMPTWQQLAPGSAQDLFGMPVVLTREISPCLVIFGQATFAHVDRQDDLALAGFGAAFKPRPRWQIDVEVDQGASGPVAVTAFYLGTSVGF